MEIEEQLIDFAERIQSGCGPYVGYDEVQQWPKGRLEEFLDLGVLIKTTPAKTVDCTECWQKCPAIEPTIEVLPNTGDKVGLYVCKKEGGPGLIRIPLERMKRWEIVVEKLIELGYLDEEEKGGEVVAQGREKPGSNVKGMTWQQAQEKAEVLVDEKGYLGFKKLYEAIGCSEGTLRKVITKSAKLQQAKEQYESTSITLKAVGFTAKVIATYETSAGPKLSDTETDEILAEMLERIKRERPEMLEPTEEQLDKMNPDQKREFAAVYKRDYRNRKAALNKKGPKTQRQYKQV